MKPVGAVTVPSVKAALPSLRIVNVRLVVAPPWFADSNCVWSAVLGVVSPSVMLAPLPNTMISGAGTITVPVMRKLNGFSFESFVLKLTSPVFVPLVVVSRRTVNVVVPPTATLAAGCAVTVKPVGAVTVPSVKAALPSLRTVNVRLIVAPPWSADSNCVWSDVLGEASSSAMLTSLPSTTISGVGMTTVPVMRKLNGFSFESFVLKVTSPIFVPLVAVSRRHRELRRPATGRHARWPVASSP